MAAHTSNVSQKKNHQLHRNVFAPRGGGGNGGVQCPWDFSCLLFSILLAVTCPRPPVFARPNILVASFATQAIVASFATQARACILSDHNIFYTPRGGGNGGVIPLGLFLSCHTKVQLPLKDWLT